MAKSENELCYRDLNIGAIMTKPGSTREYETGDWRSQRPIFNEKCNNCGICYLVCPEGCIEQDDTGNFSPNLFYCKGCGICANECKRGAITMMLEEEE